MNPTPSDGAARPDADAPDPAPGRPADPDAVPRDGVPPPRPGVRPLPRRTPKVSARPTPPGQDPAFDADDRPTDPVADEMLHRLLSGLREI